jgi:hypothetical protein
MRRPRKPVPPKTTTRPMLSLEDIENTVCSMRRAQRKRAQSTEPAVVIRLTP